MRGCRSLLVCLTSAFLIVLAGCAGDSAKSSSDTITPSTVVQAEQSSAGEVQERAVPGVGAGPAGTLKQGGAASQPAIPGLTAPVRPATPPGGPTSATVQALAGQPVPLPSYPPPTIDIAAVANALRYDQKSLSTILTAPPGLPLTKPVTISIGYFPSGVVGYGQYCLQRVTQTYVSSAGNSFLCALPEGDGRPRPLHLDITLSEPKPGGGQYSYNIPLDIPLDPLYDVTISPLIFTLIMGCSNIGANQIDLNWYFPDNPSTPQKVHFATQEREVFTIREFSWIRSEVSAAAHFVAPGFVWYEETGVHGLPGLHFSPLPVPGGQLIPGKTFRSNQGLIRSSGSTTDCQATLDYTVTYTFRQYWFNLGATPNLPARPFK